MKPEVSLKSFSGRPLRRSELNNLNLVESIYPAGLIQPRHTHDLPYFSLVLQGGYTENYGLKSLVREPSTLIFHPREEEHAVEYHSRVRIFRFEMSPRFIDRLSESSKLPGSRAEFRGDSSTSLATRLYKEFQRMDTISPIVIEGLALEIIGEALRREIRDFESRTPVWLNRAKEILHEQFSEDLTLAVIAEKVGVHPVYLARQFRKHYHCTVGEYARRLRVEAACRKVAESDQSLAEIATEAGFYDQSHFSHTFKRMTGLTPAEFRVTFRAG
jgi:AraC family transcriptional regulator